MHQHNKTKEVASVRSTGYEPKQRKATMKKTLKTCGVVLLAITFVAISTSMTRGVAKPNQMEIIKPNIGEPLRDPAVVRAPDGTYYLTGTRCMNRKWIYNPETKKEEYTKPEITRTPDGKPDFMNNDGVRLWSSKDLKEWKDEGLIVDLMERRRWHDGMTSFYAMPDRPLGAEPVRGWTAPRLQRIGSEWYLTASNGDCDVRWFKAPKPTGPYVDAWKDTDGIYREMAPLSGPGHGMLFQDVDGTVWLIRGHGIAQRMLPDMSNFERGKAIFLLARVAGYPNAEWCAKQFDPHAAAVTIIDGKYILTWSAYTDEAGFKREDSFYAVAERFEGPYSEPKLLLRGSGPVVLFDAGEKGWMLSCSIGDVPVLVPVKFDRRSLTALAQPELPHVPKAPKAGKLTMYDYAHSKPSGKRAERAGEEVRYKMIPVLADRPPKEVERVGRHNLVPLFDLPIQDVSVCKGSDGAWYLTGTVASQRKEGPDFENNDGIYLWRSTDLDTWVPLGKVWDIERDGSEWAKQYRIPGDNPLRDDLCRGVTAPEIHYIDGTYYIAYSMNGRGTGLLRSKSGKPEGPYEDLGRITAMGESPSIYVDRATGKKYWLWGKSLQIGVLSSDYKIEPVSVWDIFPHIFLPKGTHAHLNSLGLRHITGPFLFNYYDLEVNRVRYALAFSAITHIWQRANRDAVVVVADQLEGIWKGGASRMIPHGGQTTVFPGPKDELYATFWGADPSAVWRDRPGIVPMELWRPPVYHDQKADPMRYPRMVHGDYFTRRGLWATMMPPKGMEYFVGRDMQVFLAPDGYLYFGASPSQFVNQPDFKWEGTPYWHSKSVHGPWEYFGNLYTMEQMRDEPRWPDIDENYKHWNTSKGAWTPKMSYGRGTYWLTIRFGGTGWGKDVCWKQSKEVLLRSESGKPEGPYKLHMIGPTNLQGIFFDDDGQVYASADGPIWRLNADLTAIDETWTERDGVTPIITPSWIKQKGTKIPRSDNGRLLTEDCNFILFAKMGKRYIARGLTGLNSYDAIFWWSEDVRGPWHYMGVLPFQGNSDVVKDPQTGRWFSWTQCADCDYFFARPYRRTDKYDTTLVTYEVTIDMESDKPSICPTHDLPYLNDAVYRKYGRSN
jgi:beta-xylosidase